MKRIRVFTPEQKQRRKEYAKMYRDSHPEMMAAYRLKHTHAKRKEYAQKYYQLHKEKYSARAKTPAYKKQQLKRHAERNKTDPNFNLRCALRSRIYWAVRKASTKKAAKTQVLIGCTVPELRSHLESLFLPGMSWENRSEWHVDHIRPCAVFDLTDPVQQRACFHFSNLQPLWKADNLRKSDSIIA